MPRYNPNDERQLSRLVDAVKWSRKQIGRHVEKNIETLSHYVGNRYGDGGTEYKRPVNMLRMAVDVWARKLISRAPAALVTTIDGSLKTRAHEFQIALNHLIKEINLAESLSECVRMSLMGLGVMKVGICATMDVQSPNYLFDNGQPYAEPVLWEDWVHDMNARRFDEVDFAGNRMRLDYDELLNNPMYDQDVVSQLQPTSDDEEIDELGENENSRSSVQLSEENSLAKTEFRSYVEAWEFWLPRDNLLVVLPSQRMTKPLLVKDFEGPERGPFRYLRLGKVPGNTMNASPAGTIFDVDDLYNKLFCKTGRQAERQKSLTFFDSAGAQDGTAQKIIDAADGEGIPLIGGAASVAEKSLGGANPQTMAIMLQLRQIVSYFGGNIDAQGGLAPQSGTAKQDTLLAQGSSQVIVDLQEEMAKFTGEVMNDLGWYLFHDPFIQLPLVKRIPGTDIEVPFVFSAESLEGDYYDFAINIEPHSLKSQTPDERMAKLMQVISQVVMPLAPILASQGYDLNVGNLIEILSQYSDLPELKDILRMTMQQPQQQPNAPPQRSVSAPTDRRYVHESRSTGGTPAAREAVLANALMGSGLSPQQNSASSTGV